MNNLGFGAHPSKTDGTEFKHDDYVTKASVAPPQAFSVESIYTWPHYNQNAIGICTAIDLADMMQAVYGIPFSPQFIYNVGKKMYDGNLSEGSSIKTMLRVVENYGAAPLSMVPTDDTTKSYSDYVNQWFSPEVFAEATKYKTKYAQARLDPVGFAQDLASSQYGLMTRMAVGDEWYTDSSGRVTYNDSFIDPLRAPNPVTGGHSIKVVAYDGLDGNQKRKLRNTWGDAQNPIKPGNLVWAANGDISYIYGTLNSYVTEAWSLLKVATPTPVQKYQFTSFLMYGMTSPEVQQLQMRLGVTQSSFFGTETIKAVARFQTMNNIWVTGWVAQSTRDALNR